MMVQQEHNLLISKHNAIAIAMVGYLGLLVLISLIILSFITQGATRITLVICLTCIFVLLFVMKDPKKLNLFNKIKIER